MIVHVNCIGYFEDNELSAKIRAAMRGDIEKLMACVTH